MKALVTGANGFVGAAVVRQLIEAGHEARGLVRNGSDLSNLDSLGIEIVHGDLRDPSSLEGCAAGCDALFHVAADYRLWARDPSEIYETNIQGTHNIINEAIRAGIRRIVHTSSVATLGIEGGNNASNENTPVKIDDMIGHYKRSKYLAEHEVLARTRNERLPVVVVNPAAPIGPGDYKPTPTGRIVVDTATGRMPAYVDTGLSVVHVDDVAKGHLLALDKGRPGECYVLGGENLTLGEILDDIAHLAGRKPPSIKIPRSALFPIAYIAEGVSKLSGREPRIGLDALRMSKKKMYFSSAKAERELGYSYRPAHEALRDAFDWFSSHSYLKK